MQTVIYLAARTSGIPSVSSSLSASSSQEHPNSVHRYRHDSLQCHRYHLASSRCFPDVLTQVPAIGHFHGRITQQLRPIHSVLYHTTRNAFANSPSTPIRTPRVLSAVLPTQKIRMATSSNTLNTKASTSQTLLVQQRLRRPLSPHLSIYRPQITSTLSVLMRITGLAMSGSFCLYPLLYLASPYLGIDVSIASLETTLGGFPAFVKLPIKLAVAWTFTFHGLNSLRFLTWDTARGITNKRVAQTGWAVVGVSFASAVALATLV
jgi:succinate dehydrogenase (ubiquinone) cytochrome b560 subunit